MKLIPKFWHCWSIAVLSLGAKMSCEPSVDNPIPILWVLCMYPSSTAHAADSTWQLNYSLPGALETNQYSHTGVLPASRFAVFHLVCVYLINDKCVYAPCKNDINWNNNGLKTGCWFQDQVMMRNVPQGTSVNVVFCGEYSQTSLCIQITTNQTYTVVWCKSPWWASALWETSTLPGWWFNLDLALSVRKNLFRCTLLFQKCLKGQLIQEVSWSISFCKMKKK